jgi:hypothetical protein
MKDIDTTFFEGKRTWSKIKDKVLSGYMPVYLSKVAKLGRPILALLDLRGLTPYMGVKQRANSRSDPAKAAEIMCQPS